METIMFPNCALNSILFIHNFCIFGFRCPKVANLEFEWSIWQRLTNFHFMRKYSPLLDDLKSTFLSYKFTLYFGTKIQICWCVIRNNNLFYKCAIKFVLTVSVISFRMISCPFSLFWEMTQFFKSEQSELGFIFGFRTLF